MKTRRQRVAELIDQPAPHDTAQKSRSGSTMTVACKLPHGLQLQLSEMREARVPSLGGTTLPVRQSVKVGDVHIVNGNAVAFGSAPHCKIIAGYALTPGIPADFWEEWVKQNEDADYVRNKLIFAWPTEAGAVDMAKEHRSVKSGLQPLDGDKLQDDPRVPRKLPGNLRGAGKFDGKAEAA